MNKKLLVVALILIIDNNHAFAVNDTCLDTLDNSKQDSEIAKTIVPGQGVGSLRIGKPIPKSFIIVYGRPDGYSAPDKSKDSGSLFWSGKLLVKLNDGKDSKNIYSVFIYDSSFRTRNGLGVGSTYDEVKKHFPQGKEEPNDEAENMIGWKLKGITFYIHGGSVEQIFISTE